MLVFVSVNLGFLTKSHPVADNACREHHGSLSKSLDHGNTTNLVEATLIVLFQENSAYGRVTISIWYLEIEPIQKSFHWWAGAKWLAWPPRTYRYPRGAFEWNSLVSYCSLALHRTSFCGGQHFYFVFKTSRPAKWLRCMWYYSVPPGNVSGQ